MQQPDQGMTIMRSFARGALVALALIPASALADDDVPEWYLAGMVSHVQPDSAREMRNGLGGALVFGKPLAWGLNVETDVFGQSFRRQDEDTRGDTAYGAGVSLMFAPKKIKGLPFLLVGAGAVYEKLGPTVGVDEFGEPFSMERSSGAAPFARAGIGFHVPNFYDGFGGPLSTRRSTWSLRIDLSWYGVFTDRIASGEARVDDVRLNIGIQFNRVPPRVVAPPAPQGPPVSTPIIKPVPAPDAPARQPGPADVIDVVPPVGWYITYPKDKRPPCELEPMRDDEGFGYVDCRGKPFHVMAFDNGPDYFQEGRVRFRENGRVGFRDRTGQAVIPAEFEHAWPFCGGVARVGVDCTRRPDGEHELVLCKQMRFIDLQGREVNAPEPTDQCPW